MGKKFTCVGDEANDDGALWTMPLVLPFIFFLFYSFFSFCFFFLWSFSFLSVLSLSTGFGPLFFFFVFHFVCLHVFSLVFLLWSVVQGGWYNWRWSWCSWLAGQCFPFFFFLFFLRLFYDIPSLGLIFFLSFCSPVFACSPFRLLSPLLSFPLNLVAFL